MNPCPCGYYPGSRCRCSDYEVIHYRAKVSGPIMERVDIQKWVRKVDYFDLSGKEADYTSAQMRQLVERARKIQEERFKGEEGVYCNAQMSVAHIQKCMVTAQGSFTSSCAWQGPRRMCGEAAGSAGKTSLKS